MKILIQSFIIGLRNQKKYVRSISNKVDLVINNLDIFYNVLFLVFAGLTIRITLSSTNQNWVKTYSHSTGYLILPVVGYNNCNCYCR